MKDTFRYNKKRKHYAYIFRIRNDYCFNILLSTKEYTVKNKHGVKRNVKNIKLYKHPNPLKGTIAVYIIKNKPYIDKKESFSSDVLKWVWDINDKRKIKRMKKYKKYYAK